VCSGYIARNILIDEHKSNKNINKSQQSIPNQQSKALNSLRGFPKLADLIKDPGIFI